MKQAIAKHTTLSTNYTLYVPTMRNYVTVCNVAIFIIILQSLTAKAFLLVNIIYNQLCSIIMKSLQDKWRVLWVSLCSLNGFKYIFMSSAGLKFCLIPSCGTFSLVVCYNKGYWQGREVTVYAPAAVEVASTGL